jgi:hypothetical protein
VLPPKTEGELARILERGKEFARPALHLPQLLRKCEHGPGKLKITARGAHSLIVMCTCGAGTLALLVPARPLSKAETEMLIAISRESEW